MVLLIVLSLLFSCGTSSRSSGSPPFSFEEIAQAERPLSSVQRFLDASDGVKLCFYDFLTAEDPQGVLLFLHGGGAYGYGGYETMADQLSREQGIRVYLPDLRGHGLSEGARGDAPSPKQVWRDLDDLLKLVRWENPGVPLTLGGHSSGGGLLLNYVQYSKSPAVDRYFFLSPHFGYKSQTEKPDPENSFTSVNVAPFIFNGMTGGLLFGHAHAVRFNYPEEILKANPLLIDSITVNMSQAMTPTDPGKQFAELDKPYGLFVGGDDEIFDTEKLMGYHNLSKTGIRDESVARIVEGENHLSILLQGARLFSELPHPFEEAP